MIKSDINRPAWRIRRLLEIMEWKAKGLTNEQVAEKMPISTPTVNRELNSPQSRAIGKALIDKASALIWPLVERQLEQIEGGNLKPGQQLSHRGQLIKTMTGLVPRQIEQKIEQKTDLEVTIPGLSIEELFAEFGEPIVGEILRRRLGPDRGLPGQDPEEPLDSSDTNPKTA